MLGKKIFLEDRNEWDAAVVKWFETSTIYLTTARKHNVVSEWDRVFRQYFSYMSKLLLESRGYGPK